MNEFRRWARRALWLILTISAAWVLYLLASHYGSCRAGGTGKLGCSIFALFLSGWDVLVFVLLTINKLVLFLP
jgi:hypothetical protein